VISDHERSVQNRDFSPSLNTMGCFTVARAVLVRMLFTAHGLFSIWRLYDVTKEAYYWYLTTALIGLLLETVLTLYKKRGQEWKW